MVKFVYLGDPRKYSSERIYMIDDDVWESSAKPTDPDELFKLCRRRILAESMGLDPIDVFHNNQWFCVDKMAFLHPDWVVVKSLPPEASTILENVEELLRKAHVEHVRCSTCSWFALSADDWVECVDCKRWICDSCYERVDETKTRELCCEDCAEMA